MTRESISNVTKHFVRWSQKDECLLCSNDLSLELHHVIAVDDGGLDHYLNLVALCPNHHRLLERIKRYIIPNQSSLEDEKWMKVSHKAKKRYDLLSEDAKKILDILSEPYPLSDPIQKMEAFDDEMIRHLARDIIETDVGILHEVNKRRPRVFLGSPTKLNELKGSKNPYDLKWLNDSDFQEKIDEEALRACELIEGEVYTEVIIEHLRNLDLPYKAIISKKIGT